MTYKYFVMNRPPGYATIPDGYCEIESTLKRDHIDSNGMKVYCFGFVEYEQQLSFEKIFSFELLPDNRIERAKYMIWRDQGNRDYDKFQAVLDHWQQLWDKHGETQAADLIEMNPEVAIVLGKYDG